MARLRKAAKKKRDRIETAQAELVVLLRDLDECILRERQAIRRSDLVHDVLTPSLERLQEIRRSLRLVKAELNTYWSEEETRRWEAERKD